MWAGKIEGFLLFLCISTERASGRRYREEEKREKRKKKPEKEEKEIENDKLDGLMVERGHPVAEKGLMSWK